MAFRSIVVLTGAGLSAESGLGTFRDKDGLWSQFPLEEVATPEGFARNPARVHDFYNLRRRLHGEARPNAAHAALARLERQHGGVLTVTQNIDGLHEAAGTHELIHMHGELCRALCAVCLASYSWAEDLSTETVCAACGRAGAMRPDVVWFGEMPREMDRIYDGTGCLRSLHLDRHERQRLSGGRLRGRSARGRRAYGRAQSRALRGGQPVRRSALWTGDGDRPGLCREAASH